MNNYPVMWRIIINKVVKLQMFFMFIPKIGEADEPILTCAYFVKGVVENPPTRK